MVDPSSLAATVKGRLELQHQEEERNAAYHRVMALAAAKGMVGKLTLGIVAPTAGEGHPDDRAYSSSQQPSAHTMPSSHRPRRSTSGAARRRGPSRTRHSASGIGGGNCGHSSDSSNHSHTGSSVGSPYNRHLDHAYRNRTHASPTYTSGNGSGSDTSICTASETGWYSGTESIDT